MIYARLQISKPATGEAVPPLGPDAHDSTNNGSLRINGRLSVLDDSIKRQAFDTVQLSLRGM